MWGLLLQMIMDTVAENRGVQVEFYNRFQYTVETLLQFFHAEGNGLMIEDMKNSDYKVLEEELKMNKCSSSELIEQYFLEKISQQRTLKHTRFGRISVKCYYDAPEQRLTVEILHAADIMALDANDGKLKDAERQEEKQKTKKMERLIEKRQGKVQEIQVKCSKARNDYLLNLAAANASMNKYYLQDISSVIDRTLSSGLQLIQGTVSSLDQSQDRDHLLQTHHNTFCLPLRFQYQPHDGDQVCEVSTEHELSCELETRFKQIQNRLMTLSQETEEAGKGLLAGHSLLVEGVCDDDLEPSGGGASGGSGGTSSTQEDATENQTSKPSAARRRANLQETEILYLTLKPPMASSAGRHKGFIKMNVLEYREERRGDMRGDMRGEEMRGRGDRENGERRRGGGGDET
ncbi:hypothetical protein CRUP_034486 [Coryphaenoides rupestris]|nr:hypothetical protein CRUP_034486 [Coryphaenoides rupestris]